MQAIVSLLEASTYSRIEAIWRVLELRCGLKGIKITPYPHFSWQVAEDYSSKGIAPALTSIAATSQPFLVRTSGIGIFTGQVPVIYVVIAKDERLLRFHQELWNQCKPQAKATSTYYSPENWIPHITLAHGDVVKEGLVCAIEELAFIPFNWDVRIDNLTLVGQEGEEVGHIIQRFEFAAAEGV